MIGVVLCGGRSLRMGNDKGLLQTNDGVHWAECAYQRLAHLNIPVVLSVNRDQTVYHGIFGENTLVVDSASIKVKGPLLGLMSVHQQFPDEDLFVLACDMIDMKNEILSFLYSAFNASKMEALVFANTGYLEPLCGIYSYSGLRKVLELYKLGLIRKFSMQSILRQLDVASEPLPARWMDSFRNYNTI